MSKRKPKPERVVLCDYCQREAEYIENSSVIYGAGRDFGPVWRCAPCGAWVGCHRRKSPGRWTPLGRLANAELRKAKSAAHAAFDPMWRAKMRRDGCDQSTARSAAYRWLSAVLGIPKEQCHIGMFDVEFCRQVVRACTPPYPRPASLAQPQLATPPAQPETWDPLKELNDDASLSL